MHFTKMHSVGNDYIVLDALADQSLDLVPEIARRAQALCDRHFGIGADGIIVLTSDHETDAAMTIVNADGSHGGVCGNGLRCAAKLLVDQGHAAPDQHARITIRLNDRPTPINVFLDNEGLVEAASVDMGEPELDPESIPLNTALAAPVPGREHARSIDDRPFVPVSMGNPHAVIFEDDPDEAHRLLFTLGPAWERHDAFPERTNVHVASVVSPAEIICLSWERGVGHTLGCGSGACAVAVAAHLTDRAERDPVVRSPGGEVIVRWDIATNHLFLTGSAVRVFEGQWPDGSSG